MSTGDRSPRRSRADLSPALPLMELPEVSFPPAVAFELAVPCSEPFDDDGWRFSVDWDGCRAMLAVDDRGEVTVVGEASDALAQRFPELRFAPNHIGHLPVVLDGAIVALDSHGRPDLETLGLRVALGPDGASQLPVAFLATDVLHVDGRSLTATSLEHRLAVLTELIGHQGTVQAPETVAAQGMGLAEAAGQRGLAAVLARRTSAPYHQGVSSPDRLRIALRPRATCVISGIEDGSDRAYLLLSEYSSGVLTFSGRVKGPRHTAVERWLAARAAPLATDDSPMSGLRVHRFSRAGDLIWLRPGMTATVSHQGRHSDGTLRDPSLIAVRDDVAPRSCVRRDPVPPPVAPPTRAFAPTVLLPLPLDDAAMLPGAPI